MPSHLPVLTTESISYLAPERGGVFVDATLGLGGHATAILAAAGQAPLRLIGIDQDSEALDQTRAKLGDQVEYVAENFSRLDAVLKEKNLPEVDGILMDLGVSSLQLDTPERGFSFGQSGPLDMRMDTTGDLTAAEIVNRWPEPKLADLLFQYGEERLSRKIARRICEVREREPLERTDQLAELVWMSYPPALRHRRPHPATRTFQALRIAVNHELEVLEKGMEAAIAHLAPEGVLVMISFHSLEDRLVKHRFVRAAAAGDFELLTRKPITATAEELVSNPRSRSAKLRALRRKTSPAEGFALL